MDEKKRIGRPPKAASSDRKRVPLGFRVSAETKNRLCKIATETGRSISQQAELMIEQAFRDDRLEALLREILNQLGDRK